jgi:hypothetical protein
MPTTGAGDAARAQGGTANQLAATKMNVRTWPVDRMEPTVSHEKAVMIDAASDHALTDDA